MKEAKTNLYLILQIIALYLVHELVTQSADVRPICTVIIKKVIVKQQMVPCVTHQMIVDQLSTVLASSVLMVLK